MADQWFVIAQNSQEVHVHPMPIELEGEDLANATTAEIALMGWEMPAIDISTAPGVPHHTLMARIARDAEGVPLCERCTRETS